MSKKLFIHHILKKEIGSSESSELSISTKISTGESELVISKTIKERYPVTEYDKVMKLYDDMTGNEGGGRNIFRLEER